jgi:hypothetical protein
MEPTKRHLTLTLIVSLYVAGCSGGSLTGPRLDAGSDVGAGSDVDASPGGDAGFCSGNPRGGAEIPTTHRPTAIACSSPTVRGPAVPAGGTQTCGTNADCANDAGSLFTTCLQGHCSFDHCVTDADCGAGGACVCATDYYGGSEIYHANICVTAACHVDADCGPNGYCSASLGYCGSFLGFYCHSKADTCVDETKDCVGCGNACVYSPTIGAFTCGMNICAG